MTTGLPEEPDRSSHNGTAHSYEKHSHRNQHFLDALVPDPSEKLPLCDEPRFAEIVERMVADSAPRVFAVVQEYGQRVDARIAAWGMAFDDRAEVVSVERGMRMSLQTAEHAVQGFAWGSHIHPRLVWFNPQAATPLEDEDDKHA